MAEGVSSAAPHIDSESIIHEGEAGNGHALDQMGGEGGKEHHQTVIGFEIDKAAAAKGPRPPMEMANGYDRYSNQGIPRYLLRARSGALVQVGREPTGTEAAAEPKRQAPAAPELPGQEQFLSGSSTLP